MYWGPELEWLDDKRYTGERDLENPLAAVQMGLIYVNPEGPNGNPDPLAAAIDIRETFGRMAMNDIETAALIVGGHTFGKTHGNGDAELVGPEPEAAPIWSCRVWAGHNPQGTGVGKDAVSSGLEVIWTHTPTKWDNSFLEILYGNEWELFKSPAGANQWRPKDGGWANSVPEAFGTGKTHPSMLTSDLALRFDPIYEQITRRWLDHPEELAEEFAKAWFKLLHRDMGPVVRYLGPEVPKETWLWQDVIPAGAALSDDEVAKLKNAIAGVGSDCVATGFDGVEGGVVVPRQRQARRRQRWPHPAAAAARLGGQRARRAGPGDPQARGDPASRPGPACRSPTWWSSVARSVSKRPPRTPVSTSRCRSPRVAAMPPRSRPTSSRSPTWSRRSDGFRNYLGKGGELPAEFRLVDRANLLGPVGSGDDGSGRWPARAGRQLSAAPSYGVLHRQAGCVDERLLRQPARHGHRVEAVARRRRHLRRQGPRHRRRRSGPAAASICCSARTRSCGRWPRCTPRTTPRRSSSRTSSPRGPR